MQPHPPAETGRNRVASRPAFLFRFLRRATCAVARVLHPDRHGLAVPDVRAPPAGPRRSVSGGARASRDLSRAGGRAARRRGSARLRRAGVPGLSAVRLARGRLCAVPVCVRLRTADAVLLQGAGVLSELLRAADDRARRASGRRDAPARPRTPMGVESAVAPALSAGLGSRPVSRGDGACPARHPRLSAAARARRGGRTGAAARWPSCSVSAGR